MLYDTSLDLFFFQSVLLSSLYIKFLVTQNQTRNKLETRARK